MGSFIIINTALAVGAIMLMVALYGITRPKSYDNLFEEENIGRKHGRS